MVAREPIAYRVTIPRPPEYALHVGTAGALARRRPTTPLPHGSVVVFPGARLEADEPGALAIQLLSLPGRDRLARYHPPGDLAPTTLDGWQWSSDTGLDLPAHVVDEIAFERHSGMGVFEPPDLTFFDFDDESIEACAWSVLTAAPPEVTCALLGDLALKLDLEGPGGATAERTATALALRWHRGRQAVQSAKLAKVWLHPRCLRWTIRELAAAYAAVSDGRDQVIALDPSAQLLRAALFGHLDYVLPDATDLTMAAWLLHRSFNGFGVGGGERSIDAVEVLTTLGAMAPEGFRALQRLTSWAEVWDIPDTHPVHREAGWNGRAPSELRAAFEASSGLTTKTWFAMMATVVTCPVGAIADRPTTQFRVEDFGLRSSFAPAKRLLDSEVATTIIELGRSELAHANSYAGLGSLHQAEVSPLSRRPLLRLGDIYVAVSADALVRRGIDVVSDVVAREVTTSRKTLNGTVGRMFEAHCANVVDRLDRRRHVVLSNEDIRLRSTSSRNGDAVVATAAAAIIFEFSLQSPSFSALRGSRVSIDRALQRYLDKMSQARSTPLRDLMLSKLGTMPHGHFVVVDDPLTMSAAHAYAMSELSGQGDGAPFVISVVDLELLVELANHGHDFAAALLTWNASMPVRPFSQKLFNMEWLSGDSWFEQAIERIVRLTTDAVREADAA